MKVAKANKVSRVSDGGGRYLQVANTSGRITKSWIFKYVSPLPHPSGPRFDAKGKPKRWVRDMGFGRVGDPYDLDAFRAEALKARALVFQGLDPIEDRRTKRGTAKAENVKATTFREAAKGCIKDLAPSWRGGMGGRQAQQWTQSLTDFAYPTIGQLPVAIVERGHVIALLKPQWADKPTTMERVRTRIEAVLDWARGHGLRSGDNPAAWKGNLDAVLVKPSKIRSVVHHAALPYTEVPSFMAKLRAKEGTLARLTELVVLTAARLGEAHGAKWDEVDFDTGVWTVPAERMKGKREHKVPLSDRAIEILRAITRREGSPWIFRGVQSADRPIATGKIGALLDGLAGDMPATVHGFRSSFRDWCGDVAHCPREIAEAALAHRAGDSVEQSDRRGTAIEKRRSLMDAWSDYCSGEGVDAKAVQLKRTA
jgi:integrase